MGKKRAIVSLCAHLKRSWEFYAATPIIPALLIYKHNMWNWVPLLIEFESGPDEELQYLDAVRDMIHLHQPLAAALVGERRTAAGNKTFFAMTEFRNEPGQQTILWNIDENRMLFARRLADTGEQEIYPSLFVAPISSPPRRLPRLVDLFTLLHCQDVPMTDPLMLQMYLYLWLLLYR